MDLVGLLWLPWCGRCLRFGLAVALLVTCAMIVTACSSSVPVTNDAEVVNAGRVLLVPQVDAGWAGWCAITTNGGVGGCPPGRGRLPIVAESWGSGGPPAATVGYAVTSDRVRFVEFDNGHRVPTVAGSGLPDQLRSAVVEIRGKELLDESSILPRFIPLDVHGRQIRQTGSFGHMLGVSVPTRFGGDKDGAARKPCQILTAPMAGLSERGGSVVSEVKSYGGLIAQGFLSCASESYILQGWPLLAGVLLNAGHPGSAPAPLMYMTPLRGHPGIFQAPGPEGSNAAGELLAKRFAGGWLVTARAKLRQRLMLLDRLRAVIHVNVK